MAAPEAGELVEEVTVARAAECAVAAATDSEEGEGAGMVAAATALDATVVAGLVAVPVEGSWEARVAVAPQAKAVFVA